MDKKYLALIALAFVGFCIVTAPAAAYVNVTLLLAGNSSPIIDSSPSHHTITATAVSSTSVKKFGAASINFNNTGVNLTLPAGTSDFDFGNDDWSISGWWRPESTPASTGTQTWDIIFATDKDDTHRVYFGITNTSGTPLWAFRVCNGLNPNVDLSGGTITLHQWYWYVVSHHNGTYYLYLNGVLIDSEESDVGWPYQPSYPIVMGSYRAAYHFANAYADDTLITRGSYVNESYVPDSEIISMVGLTAGGDYSGGWGTAPHTVTLTSFSTGSPDSYNWTLGDGEYNNSAVEFQHTYFYPGIYNISLTVRNLLGFESTYPAPDPVVVYYNPDINYVQYSAEIEQYYPVSATVKDANTGELIPTSALYDEYGASLTGTGTGSFTGSLSEGGHVLTAVSSYYANATEAIAVTSGTNQYTIEMIATGSNPSVTTYFTPYTAKIKAVDESGVALPYAYFSVVYKGSSLPNTSTSWLTSMYGLSEETASELVDTETPMTGYAGTDGSLVFTLFKSLKYGITISNVTEGWSNYVDISPIEDEYTVICPRATTRNNTATPITESRLPFYVINETASGQCYNLSMTYQDLSGDADGLKFQVWTRDRSTLIYEEDYGDPGTDLHVANYTFCGNRGDEVIWLYNQSMPR